MSKALKEIRHFTSAIALLAPVVAHAWGAAGHRLIAELAEARLTPFTRHQVQALLAFEPGATLSSISTWADEVRSPSTARWHFISFDRAIGCHYTEERHCSDGQCIVTAINRQVDALATGLEPRARLKALKWVVHPVADAHQPLHAGLDGDKGGNLYQVRAFGRGSNLHAVWDSGLINNWPGGLDGIRQSTIGAIGPQMLSSPSQQWVEESCTIASSPDFYPDGRLISEQYRQRWSEVLAERLRAAANRLANTLELALSK